MLHTKPRNTHTHAKHQTSLAKANLFNFLKIVFA